MRFVLPPSPAEDLPPAAPAPQDFNIPDEAYGAQTAFGLLDPGEQLDPAYRQEADRANRTRAAELQNQFLDRQRQILHTGPDAFLSKTGRDAVLGANDAFAKLDAARQEALDQAANPAQRKLLQEALGQHAITEHYRIGSHVGEQSLHWQKQTALERLNQLLQQAAVDHNDADSIEAYGRASEGAARELARALRYRPDSPETTDKVEAARSAIWRHAIEAALAKGNLLAAIELHDRAGDLLTDDDTTTLAPQIAAAKEHQVAQRYVGQLPVGKVDLAVLDMAHRRATAQNHADWPDNDSQRATNQHLIDVAFGQKRQEATKAKADLVRQVDDWLGKEGQTKRPPVQLWAQLDKGQQQAVDGRLRKFSIVGVQPSPEAKTPDPAAISVPLATADAMPEVLAEAARQAARGAGKALPYVRFAGSRLIAPLALLDTYNTQATTIDMGTGLRARLALDDRTVNIEQQVDEGVFSSGVGAKWEKLPVHASKDTVVGGRTEFTIDIGELRGVLGDAGAAQALGHFTTALLPDDLLKRPTAIEIRMAETGKGEKVVIKEVSNEDTEKACPNYRRYWEIAQDAGRARAVMEKGPLRGIKVHNDVKEDLTGNFIQGQLDEMGLVELSPELALLDGVSGSYSRGHSRIDIVEIYRGEKVICAYDIKTGSARFKDKKMISYAEELNHWLVRERHASGYRLYVMPIQVPYADQ